ncbi:MAG: YeiH family protein [Myxococcota bacterium]
MDKVQPTQGLGNPYTNPELFQWLDSLEGAPEWLGPAETDDERAHWAPWQRRGNYFFGLVGSTLPGLVLALLIAAAGRFLADVPNLFFGFDKTPISPILVAILLGLFVRNAIGLPTVYEAGLQLALKRILRVGVALLGIRLSLAATGAIGLAAFPIVICCIATALFFVTRIGKIIGLPPRLATLIAVGTAICGNSAIVAIAPVIDASDDEVSYAVGCVTLFGLIALLLYPYLGYSLFEGDPTLVGLFLGTAIHDTAQVAGAGMVYLAQFGTPEVLDAATVTKLQRNIFMIAVIPLMAIYGRSTRPGQPLKTQIKQAMPFFVFGFLGMSLLRTLGDLGETPFGVLAPETWNQIIDWTTRTATVCLAVAMSAVGLGTSFSRLRGLGLKPMAVGFFAALLVGAVSVSLIKWFAPMILA